MSRPYVQIGASRARSAGLVQTTTRVVAATTKTTSLATASAVLALAVGGGAFASASGGSDSPQSGEIKACVKKHTGKLRIVRRGLGLPPRGASAS